MPNGPARHTAMALRDDLPMYYVYLLQSRKDGKLYTGYTDNLKRRLAEHS